MTSRRIFLEKMGKAFAAPLGLKYLLGESSLAGWDKSPSSTPTSRSDTSGARQFSGPIGLELYSLRKQLPKDIPGTLAMVRQIGYTLVETAGFHGLSAEEFRQQLDKADLKCTSVFFPPERFQDNIASAIKDGKIMGAEYLICGVIPGYHQRSLTLDDYHRAAETFNHWARELRTAGLHFGYHNHDYEFRPFEDHPAIDTLIGETEPGLVDFEMDVFWVKRGGQDPVAYLERYPNRFRLVHLKDMKLGTPIGDFSVGTSEEASTALGKGILDFPSILREAAKVGVRRYYVEDESTEAPEGIRVSYRYLQNVSF